jgi:NADH:ubiquinone oxidoreductase subunit E
VKILKVCIGSACHLKGSYDVIEIFQQLIKEYEIEDKIELKAAFCLGKCTGAVSVQLWDGEIISVSKETAQKTFQNKIMALL